MATSKFQDIRAAFKSLITARFATDAVTGVVVTHYPPMGNVTRQDRVWVGNIQVEQEPLSMGGTGRRVAETLTINLSVRAPNATGTDDTTYGEAEARAEAIFASIETALRNDSTVGGTVMFAQVESFESIPDNDGDGPIGVIEAVVTAEANL
jgi:hypothetical protein